MKMKFYLESEDRTEESFMFLPNLRLDFSHVKEGDC